VKHWPVRSRHAHGASGMGHKRPASFLGRRGGTSFDSGRERGRRPSAGPARCWRKVPDCTELIYVHRGYSTCRSYGCFRSRWPPVPRLRRGETGLCRSRSCGAFSWPSDRFARLLVDELLAQPVTGLAVDLALNSVVGVLAYPLPLLAISNTVPLLIKVRVALSKPIAVPKRSPAASAIRPACRRPTTPAARKP
jgi:hypothetical protein